MAIGKGSGYKNMIRSDPVVHQRAGQGKKTYSKPIERKMMQHESDDSSYNIVGSYAKAEALGIKPVDSIISIGETVAFIGREKPFLVVGYSQGYSFKQGEVKFDPRMKYDYVAMRDDGENYQISAINDKVALVVAKNMFHDGKFRLVQEKKQYRILQR